MRRSVERLGDDAGGAFWAHEADALAVSLGSGPGGLPAEEAAARRATVGPNTVEGAPRSSAWRIWLGQFASPLVLVLVAAAAISIAVREWVDASIVLAVVLGTSLLTFAQEYRASRALALLQARLALTARVRRDGVEHRVPVRDLVPGDRVRLTAGDLVPADGVVVAARDFLVVKASLTGESFPTEKRPGAVAADAAPAERRNAVFYGSSVRSGEAEVLVVVTGARTAFGGVAARLRARPPETEFARGVRHFGYLLVRLMLVVVVAVLAVNLALGAPPLESVMFAAALAVGLSPELLPAIVGVTEAAGARALGRRGVLVRRLSAIEDLGGIDVLCTDKTGTLTQGTTALRAALDPAGEPSEAVLRLGYLNAALETGIANPLDEALVAAGTTAGLALDGLTKVDEIPYDFARRRLTVVVEEAGTPGRHLLITKGAFDEVLAACTTVAGAAGPAPLDPALRTALVARYRHEGEAGHRVLAVASKDVEARADHDRDSEVDLVFRGLLVFHDPPKADAARTLRDLAALGVRVKVVSGDNRYVTAHLAREIGLDPAALRTGAELAALRDEALWHVVRDVDLFVEIDPQQKERLVRALQRTGHAVGYLGDGINDAPALHAADVGISVDGAADVARESADVVLLAPDLDVLRQGIEGGRRTFANTLKYVQITTSANLGNMVSMAIATPFLPFLPLAAKQILLNNFLSDLPTLALASDRVDADQVARATRWQVGALRRFMLRFGLLSSVFDLFTFAVLRFGYRADAATFQTTWFVVSLLTELVVVLQLRSGRPTWRARPGRVLLGATAAVAALALAAPYLGGPSRAFGFVPLPPALLATALGVVAAYAVATEALKPRAFGAAAAATTR